MIRYYVTTVPISNDVCIQGKYRRKGTIWAQGNAELMELFLLLPDGKEIKLDEHNVPHQIRDLLDSSEPDYFGDLDDSNNKNN